MINWILVDGINTTNKKVSETRESKRPCSRNVKPGDWNDKRKWQLETGRRWRTHNLNVNNILIFLTDRNYRKIDLTCSFIRTISLTLL